MNGEIITALLVLVSILFAVLLAVEYKKIVSSRTIFAAGIILFCARGIVDIMMYKQNVKEFGKLN